MKSFVSRSVAYYLIVLIAVFLVLPLAYAQVGGGPPPNPTSTGSGGGQVLTIPNPLAPCTQIDCIVGKIIDGLIIIGAPITTIMVIAGSLQISTSAGNPDKWKKGWMTIGAAVVGYGGVLFSKAAQLIINNIVN